MVPYYHSNTRSQVFDFSIRARTILKIFQILNFINCPGAGKLEGAGTGKAGFHGSWNGAGKLFDRELELWYNKMGKYFL